MENLERRAASIKLKINNQEQIPESLKPKNGKTVYDYAKQGGYTGTENQFIQIFNNFIEYYPVDSVFITVSSISPASIYGGTWERIENKFLLCAGDIYKINEIGGEENHTLSKSEMATHNHRMTTIHGKYPGGIAGFETYEAIDNGDFETDSSGGLNGVTQPHNNMPPYITKKIWRRIG